MAEVLLKSHLNLSGNEIQNAVIQNLATAPSNPVAGQFYFDTETDLAYIYDGTKWVNAMSTGDYVFQNGLEELTGANAGKVQIKLASGNNAGNVTLTADSNGLAASVAEASTSAKGIIEIATDSEAATGTAEDLAVNPKQLAGAVADKIELTDLSIASASSNYLTYDNTTGEFGANVDTTVTDSSTNLVTSGAVASAISTALVGGVIYKGTWAITTATTDYSGITLPVKQGYLYYVTGTGPATVGGIEWNPGDYLLVNEDVAAGGTLTNVSKIDNTEASDIVRLSATQTLTNKTIDGDDNTITDIGFSSIKSADVVDSTTGIASTTSASDAKFVTEKAVASALDGKAGKLAVQNPALTPASGVATWTITNTLGTADVIVMIKEVSTGETVITDVATSASNVVVKFNAATTVAADTYKAVIIGC